jgi:hypothetical protein
MGVAWRVGTIPLAATTAPQGLVPSRVVAARRQRLGALGPDQHTAPADADFAVDTGFRGEPIRDGR